MGLIHSINESDGSLFALLLALFTIEPEQEATPGPGKSQ